MGTVDGDAPAAVAVTGAEVSNKLQSENTEIIGGAISSKVDESFGAGVFDLSLQAVKDPEVSVASSVITSTSTMHPTVTVTNATAGGGNFSLQVTTSATPGAASSTTTASATRTFLQVDAL